jgi:selenocysteine-specific elongation factor
MRVIGTAGHVDHGKSTLVKALTGIDPDRLKEEQQRAMTIDLGFAWLTLPGGESVGIVDVPGHQDFIKNMLAGVGGIDAALFVIAADEGVMPQTREHLAILDLLEIPRGIIVLTKADLVGDQDWLELVQADIAETVAKTVLANAPIIPVSAIKGTGLNTVVETLDRMLTEAPARPNRGRPRLPIDRIFSMSGFGTVVTGTLLDGQLRVGQEVEILPQGIKSRIRGLQSHKKSVDMAQPGSRTAVNLTGLSVQDIFRGNVLTSLGWLEPSQLIDVQLKLLSDSPRPLRHNQEVELFTGATEAIAHTRLLGVRQLEPGQTGWVQLRLMERIPVIKGDRFIIRQPSPSLTIGGGVVVDPLPRRRHRRFQPDLIERLNTLLAGTPEDVLLANLDRRGPTSAQNLLAESRLPMELAVTALENLLKTGEVFFLVEPSGFIDNIAHSKLLIASRGGWATLLGQITTTLMEYHQRFPLRAGMPRSELKSRLKLETRLFNEAIQQGYQAGELIASETMVRLANHQIKFNATQQVAVNKLLNELRAAPYNTPLPKDIALAMGEEVMQSMIEVGQLTRLSPEVILLTETYNDFIKWLKDYLQQNQTINVAQVRDIFRTSRKYALALLEYTDEQRITKRVGDDRVLRE